MTAGALSGTATVGEQVDRAKDAVVVSASPLSSDFRSRLEAHTGARPEYLLLSTLRRMRFWELASFLRSLTPQNLYLPMEDQDANAMRPILECVAALTRARQISVIDSDFRAHRVERSRALVTLFELGLATVDGYRTRQRTEHELAALLRAERIPLAPIERGEVAYLNANLWFGVKAGGSAGHIAGVANALHRGGWPVRYLSAATTPMLESTIRCERLELPRMFALPPEVNNYRFNRTGLEQAVSILRRHRPALIYQRMSAGNYFGVQVSRALNIPIVIEYNGSEVWAARNWGRPMQFESLAVAAEDVCLTHAHLLVVVSEALRDELIERGVEAERIVCYPNCIDPTIFDPARFDEGDCSALRARYALSPDDLVVTFVGTFGRWHGVDVLAEMVRDLIGRSAPWLDSRRVKFLFVGDGALMPRVRELLDTPECAEYVRLAGLVPQHDAALHLAASDILMSPHVRNPDGSRFFGSPTKLFEYMAMEKAIVASDLDQIGRVLQPALRIATTGSQPTADQQPVAILCEPGDRVELEAALRFAVEHPAWRRRLGESARTEALSKYLWTHHVNAILERLPLATSVNR